MYPNYFGLREPSFSIAPDPHYLYLSEQHKEALAHLLYGAGESGGFVLLTGEVGTGKTTVCRAFLEQLPDGVDVALILNPAMTANELLLGICDELRIPVPGRERSVKVLIDLLNGYLLDAHARGRRPLLIIDEAQNLRPKVMEQIRLLTNLETNKHKLLQIFLIGQPELRRMLEREGLRQIDQRITARFHLRPLTISETGDYIRHRVAVAGVDRPLFTAAAIRRIHGATGGVPRLVNILCDRALLGACVTRANQVTPAIVAKAAREVRGQGSVSPVRPGVRAPFAVAASLALLLAAGWLGYDRYYGDPALRIADLLDDGILPGASQALPEAKIARSLGSDAEPKPEAASIQVQPTADRPSAPVGASALGQGGEVRPGSEASGLSPMPPAAAASTAAALPPTSSAPPEALPQVSLARVQPQSLAEALPRLALPEADALRVLLRRWGVEVQDLGAGDPCGRAAVFGLRCEREQGRLSHVRYFDRPVLLRVADRGGVRRFLVLGSADETTATLDLPESSESFPAAALEGVWSGDYTVVWQPPPTGATVVGPGAAPESIRWLREMLAKTPESNVVDSESGAYDGALTAAVRRFQAARGLQADGIAGPRTLIQLQNAASIAGTPRLMESGSAVAAKVAGQATAQDSAATLKASAAP